MASFDIGDVIADKYKITDVLGKGGMGIVYAARHRELDELVALKFLLRSQGDSPEVAKRFLREARAGMRIKSQHVARVSDVGTASGGGRRSSSWSTSRDETSPKSSPSKGRSSCPKRST